MDKRNIIKKPTLIKMLTHLFKSIDKPDLTKCDDYIPSIEIDPLN